MYYDLTMGPEEPTNIFNLFSLSPIYLVAGIVVFLIALAIIILIVIANCKIFAKA